ncbi:MAG: outer membrane lipoprotein-sorting protein [Gammaproteobacteria bacterium]
MNAVPTAEEIMQRNFFSSKPKQLSKDVTMTLVNDQGQTRERKVKAISVLQPNGVDSNMLVRFLAPSDIKGTGFLQIEHLEGDDDQWIYLPALHKSRRLVSSNKKDSFMGSDFSYGDVLPPKVSNYHHKLLKEEAIEGQDCYVIESVPIDEGIMRDSGYSRKTTWIRKDNFHETKVEYSDLSGRLLKTQIVRGIILVEPDTSRWTAIYKEMVNHQTGHKTIFNADQYSTDVTIASDMFSLRTLERE